MSRSRSLFFFVSVAFCYAALSLLFYLPLPVHASATLWLDTDSDSQAINQALYILDNPDGRYSADAILAPDIERQFAPLEQSRPAPLAAYSNGVWLRFVVANDGSEDLRYWFSMDSSVATDVALYQRHGNKLFPVADAPVQNERTAAVLKELLLPAAGQSHFYLKIDGLQSHTLRAELVNPARFFNDSLSRHRQLSFAIGMLLFNVLLCLSLGLVRRSRLLLYQGAFVMSVLLVQFAGGGVPEISFAIISKWQFAIAFFCIYLACVSSIMILLEMLRRLDLPVKKQQQLKWALWIIHLGFAVLLLSGAAYSALVLLNVAVAAFCTIYIGFYCFGKAGDKMSLAVTLVKIASITALSGYFLYNHNLVFVQMIDPFVLYCMVVETGLITLIFLMAELHAAMAYRRSQLQVLQSNITDQARHDLLRDLSHDIRTPASNIIGIAGLLRDGSLGINQLEKVNTISHSAQILLNRLAELEARVETGGDTMRPQIMPFELPLLVESSVRSFRMTAESNHTELIINIQPDVPVFVYGDQARLRQVLIQLVGDAVEQTRQGEVIVRVSRQASDPDDIHFLVGSRGLLEAASVPGEGLRNRHQQATANDNGESSGLVNQLLLSMGAQWHVTQDGEDSRRYAFSLTLPAMPGRSPGMEEAEQSLRGRRLLVVDDNHTSCQVLKQQAASWGMLVSEAYDGNEAVALYFARYNRGEAFDVLIVDYDMPSLSGIEVAGRILQQSKRPPLIIMLTGLMETPPEEAVREAGIAAVLNKPASQQLVRQTLINLLPARAYGQGKQSCRVLVAEDNDVSRRVISKLLHGLGMSCKLVANGELALEAVKRGPFDLILMDCEMPLMDGFEATHAIHQWQKRRGQALTPVIAMTAHGMGEQQRKSREAGMTGFLTKPVAIDDLKKVIEQYSVTADKR